MKNNCKEILQIFSVLLITTSTTAGNMPAQPFAVVELFTSEGCSSCPPADRLLATLTEEARKTNSNILTLSFHVDYWNYLGWKDPFSKNEFSQRQRDYARALKNDSVYTPQMLVNGEHEFIGNNSSLAQKYVNESLALTPKCAIAIQPDSSAENTITIKYETINTKKGNILNIALVERKISVDVTRGENAGKYLKHENVVKAFKTIHLSSEKGTVELVKPSQWEPSNASIFAYVQNDSDLKIIAAVQADI